MPTIQTVPNKERGITIQTVPNKETSTKSKPIKTKTKIKTLPNSSTVTEVVLATEIPDGLDTSQPQNSVALWFSKNQKATIGISCGLLFLMIVAAIIFQVRRKKVKRRGSKNQAVVSPTTPKTPPTPETPGLRERRRGPLAAAEINQTRIKQELSLNIEQIRNLCLKAHEGIREMFSQRWKKVRII